MSEELTIEELIELAKKAPPVPVGSEFENTTAKLNHSSIADFLSKTGLRPGRNEMNFTDLYEAYRSCSNLPMDIKNFKKGMNSMFKKATNKYYKTNMKLITLQEIIKGLQTSEKE